MSGQIYVDVHSRRWGFSRPFDGCVLITDEETEVVAIIPTPAQGLAEFLSLCRAMYPMQFQDATRIDSSELGRWVAALPVAER